MVETNNVMVVFTIKIIGNSIQHQFFQPSCWLAYSILVQFYVTYKCKTNKITKFGIIRRFIVEGIHPNLLHNPGYTANYIQI